MSLTNTKTGFSVKDILDLPDTNDEDGSAAEGGEEESEAPEPPKKPGVLGQTPLDTVQTLPLKNPFYDNSDNPYTRWLASAEGIQYSREYRRLTAPRPRGLPPAAAGRGRGGYHSPRLMPPSLPHGGEEPRGPGPGCGVGDGGGGGWGVVGCGRDAGERRANPSTPLPHR